MIKVFWSKLTEILNSILSFIVFLIEYLVKTPLRLYVLTLYWILLMTRRKPPKWFVAYVRGVIKDPEVIGGVEEFNR